MSTALPDNYEDAIKEIIRLERDLLIAKANAVRYEVETHSLRRQIQNLRSSCDTERIGRESCR